MKNDIDKLLEKASENIKNKEYSSAIEALEKVLLIDKNHLPALSTIADLNVLKKNYSRSIEFLDKIIQIKSDISFIHNNKGYCLLNLNLLPDAKKSFEKAIELKKDYAEAYNNLGAVYEKEKNLNEARINFKKAFSINNKFLDALHNLVKIDLIQNNLDNALINCEKALSINPNFNEINNHLGIIYKRKNEYERSISYFNKSLATRPNHVPSILNLANIYLDLKNYNLAKKNFEKSYKLEPKNPNILSNYIYLKLMVCEWDNLNNLSKEFFLMNESNKEVYPYIALLINDNCKLQKEIATKWSLRKEKTIVNKINYKKKQKINIAYFSSDFKDHPVIYSIKNTIKNHDKTIFELYGFNLSKKISKNNISEDIIDSFTSFFDCGNKSNNEIREICENLNIDIIVDLNVHTKDGRPEIFKQRCAPVQINFLGYPGTSGDICYDYIIGDNIVTPKEYQKFYSEKIIQMPNSFFPNSFNNFALKENKSTFKLDVPNDKFIFACFNNIVKFNPKIFDIWSDILKKTKDGILLLSVKEGTIQGNNILKEFKQRDISQEKIFFSTKLKYEDYLTRFNCCDLFLDTYPYGAHTTALEALYKGLPVLTIKGETFQSRVASSFLTNLQLDELIVDNFIDYTNTALKIYNDKFYLRDLKLKLNENKNKLSLFDNKKYTRDLEEIYINLVNKHSN